MRPQSDSQKASVAQADGQPVLLRGASVAPGMAFGPAVFRHRDLSTIPVRRVPQDGVENELNRLRKGLQVSAAQLESLRDRVAQSDSRDPLPLIDAQLSRLKDSVFLADVENLILAEQMGLEGAIAKVILDFDRISRLVENQVLRERASELRDVGVRVLRNLETLPEAGQAGAAQVDDRDQVGILVLKELNVSEVLGMVGGHVRGVVTAAGSLTGQAAIFLRSLRIPALTGVTDLFDQVRPGDELLLDASEGCVHVRPDRRLLDQFQIQENAASKASKRALPKDAPKVGDETVVLSATCGNLPEVDGSRELGMPGVGMYRTELLFLLERNPPGVHTLAAHYASVLQSAGGKGVVFRLADLDSSMELPYLHRTRENNPALGSAGIRALLETPMVLRRQLEGILRAAHGYEGEVGIALPRVVDVADLRAVREILFEERYSLKREKQPYCEDLKVGVVIETPASVLGAADLAGEADFLAVGLDSLQQYLLVADRDDPRMSGHFEVMHPFVLRALEQVVQAARSHSTPLRVFGVTVARPDNIPLLLSVGVRHLCVAPTAALAADQAIR
ncbi:MAG TPA: phosphoenolpyruvate-utilizing N-terminal domain-containing protein, partial [Planctomycetota bacterium]|nr:phosphoenolpyruvate-utilizing N-terminal domain-containing protein [Planctomycetota bacterium]